MKYTLPLAIDADGLDSVSKPILCQEVLLDSIYSFFLSNS